ncbi:Peroxidasin [Nymphon striatum]|nr:Peroxidasin [Nymphon striatum]
MGAHIFKKLTKGLVSEKCMKTDNTFSTELTDNLFRDSDGAAFDLVALNIQRGRDHGLQSYQRYKKRFKQTIEGAFETLALLELEMIHVKFHLFSKNSGYDLFIGGICEKNAEGAAVGPLFRRIMSTQFKNLRRGDRFFFNNGLHYSKSELSHKKKININKCSVYQVINMKFTLQNYKLPISQRRTQSQPRFLFIQRRRRMAQRNMVVKRVEFNYGLDRISSSRVMALDLTTRCPRETCQTRHMSKGLTPYQYNEVRKGRQETSLQFVEDRGGW